MHELVESVCRSMLPIETNRFHYFTTSLFVFFGRPFRLYSFFFIGKASSKSTFIYLSIGSLSLCEFERNEKLQFYWILSCG